MQGRPDDQRNLFTEDDLIDSLTNAEDYQICDLLDQAIQQDLTISLPCFIQIYTTLAEKRDTWMAFFSQGGFGNVMASMNQGGTYENWLLSLQKLLKLNPECPDQ